MSLTMYQASVPVFARALNVLSNVLDKGASFAEARKILDEKRADLEKLAKGLIEYETLTGDEIKDLLAGKAPVRETAVRTEAEHVAAAAAQVDAWRAAGGSLAPLARVPVRRRDDVVLVPVARIVSAVADGELLHLATTGGAAGTFLTAEHLDTPLTFEDFRKVGGTIGAGTIMVFDDTVDLRDVLARIGAFFAHESCGKCYPCQIGTQRQAEILARIAAGRGRPNDTADLLELAGVLTDTSICGLGQAAPWAIVSALRHWPELFESTVNL